jgi:hypothetical protein
MSGRDFGIETALDGLLATLQDGELSPLEIRILLELAHHDVIASSLATALGAAPKAIGAAARRLAMRGLIGRRFEERGRDSHFVLSIRQGGLSALDPLLVQAAEPPPRRGGDLSRAQGVTSRTARRPGTGIKERRRWRAQRRTFGS